MKSVIVLYAGGITENAFTPVLDGCSAWEKTLEWAFSVPDGEKVVILSRNGFTVPETERPVTVIERSFWTISLLLQSLAELSRGFDTIVYQWADCPFCSSAVTADLYERHCRYAAEYTFADGYPSGFTPELLAPGAVSILSVIARDNDETPGRDALFSVLKKDINSYEIETALSPRDMRYLRLTLACDTKRNTLQCSRLSGLLKSGGSSETADEECKRLEAAVSRSAGILRTLPAFYNVQISGPCPSECSFCPYPSMCREMSGVPAQNRTDFMKYQDFESLAARIEEFSGDAVIALSLWGEPFLHPDLIRFIQTVMARPSLSLLIETTGAGLTAQIADAVAAAVTAAPPRTSGAQPISWVLSLDAVKDTQYAALHNTAESGFSSALSAAEKLISRFPGAVWPQFIRLKENEAEMEAFYRFWTEKAGHVIIQKYDWFCAELADKKTADLTPLTRNPCWHLRRDMAVLLDGTVSLCREDIHRETALGNIYEDSLEVIWNRGERFFQEHLDNKYEGICGVCDEYYTYNF